jgi:5-formyltetrahydrofolate cyclo-ligase
MAVPPPPSETSAPEAGDAAGDKAVLRRMLRARRTMFVTEMTEEARIAALAGLDHQLAPLLARTGPIAGYVAHKGEADILPFLLKAFHFGHAIALPHVAPGSDAIRFTRWQPDMAMHGGLAGIPQPGSDHPELMPALVLAPLVGFDRSGRRIGQGGGFYDRWFARHPDAVRIGIAWSVQEVADIPADPWDMGLHAIVTEKEWIAP